MLVQLASGITSTGDAYTFSIEGFPDGILDFDPIVENAVQAIEYISHIVNWKGTLDFGLVYYSEDPRGEGDYGKGAVFGSRGNTFELLYEAQTGIDPFPGNIDLGSIVIGPYIEDGRLMDYGLESIPGMGLSANHLVKYPRETNSEKTGLPVRDFQNTFMHEFTHAMGIAAEDGSGYEGIEQYYPYSGLIEKARRLWTRENGRYFFNGAKASIQYGGRVEFFQGAHPITESKGNHSVDINGNGNDAGGFNERINLSQGEIAILEDWGWEIQDRYYGDDNKRLFLIEDQLWSYSDLLSQEIWKDGRKYTVDEIDGVTGFYVGERRGGSHSSGNLLTSANLSSPADFRWVAEGSTRAVQVSESLVGDGWSWWTVEPSKKAKKEKRSFDKAFRRGHYRGNVGDAVFVYRQSTGELFLDSNFNKKGWGDGGGLIATFEPGTYLNGDVLTY
jgi:hypothetical protein